VRTTTPLQRGAPRPYAQASCEINRRYKHAFGDIGWDQSDYLPVLLAGFVATLLDVFVVRIPLDGAFVGRMQAGSPMTRWIRQNSRSVHDHYLKDLEKAAKVPYDLSVGRAVDGLSPKVHRLITLGHDPILAFIFGVMDVMSGTGTYIDKHGDLRRIPTSMSPEDLIAAFLKVFLHLLSDVFTSAGIQPPLFALLRSQTLRHHGNSASLHRDDRARLVVV
jgi:hypothetical protein